MANPPVSVSKHKEREQAEGQGWNQTEIREAGRAAQNESKKQSSSSKDRSRRMWAGKGPGQLTWNRTPSLDSGQASDLCKPQFSDLRNGKDVSYLN